jgi:hypothetical protein
MAFSFRDGLWALHVQYTETVTSSKAWQDLIAKEPHRPHHLFMQDLPDVDVEQQIAHPCLA